MTGSAYALVVLFAINLMNFFDRQIIGGVGEGIRREWALSDTALGLLGTVFTLLYAASGLTRSFAQLIVARLCVGVGEATCSPASTSLIGDLVRPTSRARAV